MIIPKDLRDKETIDETKIQQVTGVKKVQVVDKCLLRKLIPHFNEFVFLPGDYIDL